MSGLFFGVCVCVRVKKINVCVCVDVLVVFVLRTCWIWKKRFVTVRVCYIFAFLSNML